MTGLQPAELRTNILSGITVSLALVPEAIAFALVAQVSPLTGLYAAFFVCLISAVLGGRPGMISGATGALAVVMVSLVVQHGAEYLFATVVLMGMLQLLFATFKLGKFIRLVPHPVMLGLIARTIAIIYLLPRLTKIVPSSLATRYLSEGKVLHLRHLTPDCLELLERAKAMVEVNQFEDPHYHIAGNKLG